LKELEEFATHTLWYYPSEQLRSYCLDSGCYQRGYTDLYELIEDHNLMLTSSHCDDCKIYNFPCAECCSIMFNDQISQNIWQYS
jgi:hypothetical protein